MIIHTKWNNANAKHKWQPFHYSHITYYFYCQWNRIGCSRKAITYILHRSRCVLCHVSVYTFLHPRSDSLLSSSAVLLTHCCSVTLTCLTNTVWARAGYPMVLQWLAGRRAEVLSVCTGYDGWPLIRVNQPLSVFFFFNKMLSLHIFHPLPLSVSLKKQKNK